ncbi:MAG: hypothetical protein FWC26_04920 [Fibromonadales bacterium]|nr:hypothetical protein [Fibromonadales bacterium]
MDTDDLSDEVYKAVILAAERFNPDLALHFGCLADKCYDDDEDYLLQAEQLIDGCLEAEYIEFLIDDMFFGEPVDQKKFKKVLLKIKGNINKIKEKLTQPQADP